MLFNSSVDRAFRIWYLSRAGIYSKCRRTGTTYDFIRSSNRIPMIIAIKIKQGNDLSTSLVLPIFVEDTLSNRL